MRKRGKKEVKKKGVSSVIITVILVAFVLILAGVAWAVINNIISNQREDISLDKLTVDAEIKSVSLDENSNNISLVVKRNPGQGELIGLKFVFNNQTNSEIVSVNASMKELDQRMFIFHLSMNISTIESILLVPLIKGENNKALDGLGKTKRIKDIPKSTETEGSQSCTPATCASLGYNCDTHANGTCAGTLNCGTCQSGYTCVSGSCAVDQSGSDLVLWLKFDDDINDGVATDSSEMANHGICSGNCPAYLATGGVDGAGAYQFDGVNDVIKVVNSLSLRPQNFTILFWLYKRTDGTQVFFGKQYNYTQLYYNSYAIYETSNTLRSYDYIGGSQRTLIGSRDIPLNQWMHAAVTYNSTDIVLYMNGTQIGSQSVSGAVGYDSEAVLIGADDDSNIERYGSFTDGTMDDVRVYNRALSASEIQNLYDSIVPATLNPLCNGLNLLYHFDNRSDLGENDTRVVDSSGYGNNGTVTEAKVNTTAGKYGNAFTFDGNNDFIEVPDTTNRLDMTTELTVMAWIHPYKLTDYKDILSKGQIDGTAFNYYLATVDGDIEFGFYNGGWRTASTNSNLLANRWYHVAATYSDSANNVKIYVNGVENISASQTYSLITNDAPFYVGIEYSNEIWNGTIDELAIWNRSLDSSEISNIYNAPIDC